MRGVLILFILLCPLSLHAQEVRIPVAPTNEGVRPTTHLQPEPFTPAPTVQPPLGLPLKPRQTSGVKHEAGGNVPRDPRNGADNESQPKAPRTVARQSSGPSLWTTFLSLGIVLGLFTASVWFLKKFSPTAAPRLPNEVLEVLGKTPLAGRQSAHLVRLGNKLLLISLTASGAETLTEVTDPIEVDRLAGLCRAQQPQSATASFRSLMEQFGKDRTAPEVVRPSRLSSPAIVDRLHGAAEEDDDV